MRTTFLLLTAVVLCGSIFNACNKEQPEPRKAEPVPEEPYWLIGEWGLVRSNYIVTEHSGWDVPGTEYDRKDPKMAWLAFNADNTLTRCDSTSDRYNTTTIMEGTWQASDTPTLNIQQSVFNRIYSKTGELIKESTYKEYPFHCNYTFYNRDSLVLRSDTLYDANHDGDSWNYYRERVYVRNGGK